jgi:hypothetical protein
LRKAVLARAGYIVFSATTPSEAMEILREVGNPVEGERDSVLKANTIPL